MLYQDDRDINHDEFVNQAIWQLRRADISHIGTVL